MKSLIPYLKTSKTDIENGKNTSFRIYVWI